MPFLNHLYLSPSISHNIKTTERWSKWHLNLGHFESRWTPQGFCHISHAGPEQFFLVWQPSLSCWSTHVIWVCWCHRMRAWCRVFAGLCQERRDLGFQSSEMNVIADWCSSMCINKHSMYIINCFSVQKQSSVAIVYYMSGGTCRTLDGRVFPPMDFWYL